VSNENEFGINIRPFVLIRYVHSLMCDIRHKTQKVQI